MDLLSGTSASDNPIACSGLFLRRGHSYPGRVSRERVFEGWLGDALLGLVVTAVVSVVISAGQAGEPQPLAYAWALGLGAIMLARRRFPRIVLLVTALGLFAYYAAGYPAIGIAVPVAAALFSAAEAGRLGTAVSTATAVLVVATAYRLATGQDASFVVGYELITHLTGMAAAIALGDGLRSRRALIAGEREMAALSAQQQAQAAEQRRRDERLAVARDLHDTLGHSLAVISLYSDVAREALVADDAGGQDTESEAVPALSEIKRASSRAMADLRSTVTVLRTDESGDRSATLASLDGLLEPARRAGLQVSATVSVDPAELPPAVDAEAYRIVQEAITNVVRHADAERLRVEISADDDQVRIVVSDDGRAEAAGIGRSVAGGHGIAGMTERAQALGGWLRAGPAADGFVVRVVLPLGGRS